MEFSIYISDKQPK